MRNNLTTKMKEILDSAAKIAANNAQKEMNDIARRTIGSAEDDSANKFGSFYGDYTPKTYNRIGNLERSYASFVDKSGKHPTAVLEFSTKYMPHNNHLKLDGGTPYDKEAVLRYDFENGWHGAPVIFGKPNPIPQMKPSPSEKISERIDSFLRLNLEVLTEDDMDWIYDDMIRNLNVAVNDIIHGRW